MTALDATGVHALDQFAKRLRKSGRTLLLCGAREQPAELLTRTDLIHEIGQENILPHVRAALNRAREINGDFQGVGRELAAEMEYRPL
jgi:SulP family sulfate permease